MGNQKYPWRTLKFDEAFTMKGTQRSVSDAAYKAGLRTGKKFTCRSLGKGMVEVRRNRSSVVPNGSFIISPGATLDYLVSLIHNAETITGWHEIEHFGSFMHRCIDNGDKAIVKHFMGSRDHILEMVREAYTSQKLKGNVFLGCAGIGSIYFEHDNYAFKCRNDLDMLVMRRVG